jgi:hypothetical protein
MLRRIPLVRTDVSEECIASIIRFETIRKPEAKSAVTVMMEAIHACNITEDDILHNHRREYLKSYIELTGWDL